MNTRRVLILLAATASFFFAPRAGYANLITNGSFEESAFGTDSFSFAFLGASLSPNNTITDWTVNTPGGVYFTDNYWQASNGSHSLEMSGLSGDPSSISQVLNTNAGQTYVILFDLAGDPFPAPHVVTLEVLAASAAQDYTFDTTGHRFVNMGWQTESFAFTATGTSTTLTFTGLTNSPFGPALDNVRAVPEPGNLMLFAVGLASMVAFVRMKNRKANVAA
jgi:choice-of-anchor C domain-containing protein